MNYSKWNIVDLHIHSKYSDYVKDNDYDGEDYSAIELFNKLIDNNVNIFSITDHNCINVELYEKMAELISDKKHYSNINYVIGVELDVYDPNIYKDVFHCLCFFDTYDIDAIKKSIDDMFDNNALNLRNNKNLYPDVPKIFHCLADNNVHNILLIPHFNNKSKGLPSDDNAINCLNYLCFDAYEDVNNIEKIIESLNIYIKEGYDEFPFVAFTDNHNLEEYPISKDGTLCSKCYMLSNVKFAFNSIKTCFEEPRLRISIGNAANMRNINNGEKVIDFLEINGSKLYLSPYQNTIIGKFGSGKSLLLEKIKKGESGIVSSSKYNKLHKDGDNFKIKLLDQLADSMDEAINSSTNLKKYESIQLEQYYYSDKLKKDEAKELFDRLNISYTFEDKLTFSFDKEDLNNKYENFKEYFESNSIKNNLNYGRAFDEQQYYNINIVDYVDNINKVKEELSNYINNSKEIFKIKLYNDIDVLNIRDSNKIDNINHSILNKIKIINYIENSNFVESLYDLIDDYLKKYINNDEKISLNTYRNDIKTFYNHIYELKNSCCSFEHVFTKEKYEKYKSSNRTIIFSDYYIESSYDDILEYKEVKHEIIKEKNRLNNLFLSVLKTIFNKEKFSQNASFMDNLDRYDTYVKKVFDINKLYYDIIHGNDSMLKKSAGEKSAEFIKLLFELIENDLNNGISVILILDQPEDNIDNENIYKEITLKIKSIKLKYNNFQCIIVTHNANVCISSDSENIIIAEEKIIKGEKYFNYLSGCIEDKDYVNIVCNILEGGKKAMEQRTVKYGINIIKKVTNDGI